MQTKFRGWGFRVQGLFKGMPEEGSGFLSYKGLVRATLPEGRPKPQSLNLQQDQELGPTQAHEQKLEKRKSLQGLGLRVPWP